MENCKNVKLTYDKFKGRYYRHHVFSQLLFANIHFSATVSDSSSTFDSFNNWAAWWQELFTVKFAVCVTDYDHYLPKILKKLQNLKHKPSEAIPFFYNQTSAILANKVSELPKPWQPPMLCFSSLIQPPLLLTSSVESSYVPKKKGRPKGSLDSGKFLNRGRPKGSLDIDKFFNRGGPKASLDSGKFTNRGRPKKTIYL